METIRTLLTAAFLAAVTLGAYYYINTPSEDREKALAALFGQLEEPQTEGQNCPPPFKSTYIPSNESEQNSTFSSEYSEKSLNSSAVVNSGVTTGTGADDSMGSIPVNPFVSSDQAIGSSTVNQNNGDTLDLPGLSETPAQVSVSVPGGDPQSGLNSSVPALPGLENSYNSPEIGSSPDSGTPASPASHSPVIPDMPAVPELANSAPAAPIAAAVGSSAASSVNPPIAPTVPSANPGVAMAAGQVPQDQQFQQDREIVRNFLQEANNMLQTGERLKVLVELSKWYNNPKFTPQENQQLNMILMKLAGEIIYLHPEKNLTPAYTVQPGDTITSLAQKYQVPWQFLAKINGLQAPFLLPSGSSLKVVQGPFNAQVNLEKYEMTLWLPLISNNTQEPSGSIYAGTFHIGLGQDTSRLSGDYIVEEKLIDPEYRGVDAVFAPNDPNNPYGNRLIRLVQYGNPHTPRIGIHGTSSSANVRQLTSRGNICLDARDINDLFDILSVGSRVLIKERD